jgi:hypothetical protein
MKAMLRSIWDYLRSAPRNSSFRALFLVILVLGGFTFWFFKQGSRLTRDADQRLAVATSEMTMSPMSADMMDTMSREVVVPKPETCTVLKVLPTMHIGTGILRRVIVQRDVDGVPFPTIFQSDGVVKEGDKVLKYMITVPGSYGASYVHLTVMPGSNPVQ